MSVLVSLIFCYFIFPFWLKGLSAIMSAALYGGCLGLIFFHRNFLLKTLKRNGFLSNIKIWFVLLGLSIALVFCIAGVYKTGDINYLSFITLQIRATIRFIGVYLVAVTIYKRNITGEEYRDFFINGICFYVVATLFLLIPALRDKWTTIVQVSEFNLLNTELESYYTRFGLQGFSGFMHTCLCDLAILFCLNKSKLDRLTIFKICLLLVGAVCYGRIGLIGGLILIMFFLLKKFRHKFTLKLLMIVFAVIGLIIAGFYYLYTQNNEELWFRWAFEPIVNLIEGNGVGSASSDTLKEMWFCPPMETILWGDGRYMEMFEQAYYMHTDVGTLRKLLFGGIGFVLLIYTIDLIPILSHLKHKNYSRYLIFCTLFMIAMFEYKGEASIYISSAFFPLLFTNNQQRHISNPSSTAKI